MQNTNDFDQPVTDDAEQNEMTSSTTRSGNVQCVEALADFRARPCSKRGRALGQAREGCYESFFVDTRLLFAKSVLGPKQDALEIGIG